MLTSTLSRAAKTSALERQTVECARKSVLGLAETWTVAPGPGNLPAETHEYLPPGWPLHVLDGTMLRAQSHEVGLAMAGAMKCWKAVGEA